MDKYLKVSQTPTITAGAYSDGDVVGGLLTFSLAGIANNGGFLCTANLTDNDKEAAALRLFLFDDLPATIADNAAFGLTDADNNKCFAIVTLGTYVTLTNTSLAHSDPINKPFVTDKGNLYGYLVCNGSTPTYTATADLTVTLRILSE